MEQSKIIDTLETYHLAPPDDEPPATGVALRSMGAGVEGATTLTAGEHSPERWEACGYTWKPGIGLQADARGESGSTIRGNADEPVLAAATAALRRLCWLGFSPSM